MRSLDERPAQDALQLLRQGVRTEHFTARVTWPNGWTGPEHVALQMSPFPVFSDWETGENAADRICNILQEEGRTLEREIRRMVSEVRNAFEGKGEDAP